MFGNKGSRNKAGISWSGDTNGGGDRGRRCDQGGDDHSGAVMVNGYSFKVRQTGKKREKVEQVRYKSMSCKRCGANWEEVA